MNLRLVPDLDESDDIDNASDGFFNEAACLGMDPDIFFPIRGQNGTLAKQVCATCPARQECRDYALEHREKFGIWGGLSQRERQKMWRGQA